MRRLKGFTDRLGLRTQFFISGAVTLCAAVGLAGVALYGSYGNARLADARSYARSLAPSVASMAAVRTREVEDFFLERLRSEKSFFYPQADLRGPDPLSSLLMRRLASQMAASVYYARLPVRALYVENVLGDRLAFDRSGARLPLEGALTEAVAEARTSARAAWGAARWRLLSDGKLAMERAVFDLETTAYLGFFVVLADPVFFDEMLAPLVQEYGAVVLFDDGRRVYSAGAALPAGDFDLWEAAGASGGSDVDIETAVPGDRLYGVLDYGNDAGEGGRWAALVLVSRSALDRSLGGARLAVAGIILLCLALALAAAYGQAGSVTRGLSLLTAGVKELGSGNFSVAVPISGGLEVAELGKEFNRMAGRLESMLAELARERTAKHEAELRSLEAEYRNLQAQLNPHFLYNALETINSTAKLDNSPRSAALSRALSVLLRGALARGDDRVPLAAELSYLESYLLFAKTVHGASLSIDVEVDEADRAVPVPRFILQPLAENALRHAYPQRVADASLVIRSERDASGNLRLSVADNGTGIPEERMRSILASMLDGAEDEPSPSAEGGVGLRNIHRRIRIRCGAPYGVELLSAPGRGTVATVLLPPGGLGDV